MEQELLDAFREIDYVCSGDHSRQGAMVLGAAGEAPRPLLVALHTWSFDFRHPSARGFAERCAERNWHLIFPNFRGPNNHPEGCGSELAVSDIVDAVAQSDIRIRDDSVALINYCRENQIPFLLFSAGLGDVLAVVSLHGSH